MKTQKGYGPIVSYQNLLDRKPIQFIYKIAVYV